MVVRHRGRIRMNIRTVTLTVALLDSGVWVVVVFATFFSGSDPATKGLDTGVGIAVTLLFLVTTMQSLFLIYRGRAPKAALSFALAFPAAFILLFVAAVIAFS
jgi:hypothetical protein